MNEVSGTRWNPVSYWAGGLHRKTVCRALPLEGLRWFHRFRWRAAPRGP
ncbi:MAG: hypothetical protein ACI9OJ_002124 [Myxococcota bacterium]|jgi:hypothetical protein